MAIGGILGTQAPIAVAISGNTMRTVPVWRSPGSRCGYKHVAAKDCLIASALTLSSAALEANSVGVC